jgi:hypothetical protein
MAEQQQQQQQAATMMCWLLWSVIYVRVTGCHATQNFQHAWQRKHADKQWLGVNKTDGKAPHGCLQTLGGPHNLTCQIHCI